MLKVGLTGGIGSGKTTVGNLFERRHIPVIDADHIAHTIVEPGQPAYFAIIEQYGEDILDQDRRLNRAKLRDIVFNCHQKKQRLESIIHPLVFKSMQRQIAELKTSYCVLSIPLLFETGCRHFVDRVLVVDCSIEMQYQRVSQRDKLSKQMIKCILATQVSRTQRLDQAEDIVTNESDIEQLDKQIENLHKFYLTLSN